MNPQSDHAPQRSGAVAAYTTHLAPLALLMLAALALPTTSSNWLWMTLLQVTTAGALLLAYAVRKRLSVSCGLVGICLLALALAIRCLDSAALIVRIMLTLTLALCIAHVWLRTRPHWRARHGVCIASYASASLLLYVCTTTATQEQTHLAAWIVLAACAACCALLPQVRLEAITGTLSSTGLEQPALPAAVPAVPHPRVQELEAENAGLRASKRDQETFVYAIAHDLRAPLRAIDAFSCLLSEHLAQPLTPRARHDLAGIHAGVGRMQDLLNCWLDIARCERAVLRRTRVDLSVIAESLARELQMLEPKRAVSMTVDAELSASADPVLVRELLQNLLSNAWKFTADSAAAVVHVGARHEGGETVFYVRDNGVGFAAAEAAELFVPFARLSSAAHLAGSGVGLAIVQRIVERHHGRIWAEAELGHGATFCFTLMPQELAA